MKNNMDVHYSSKTVEWATPQSFFDELDKEFHFTLDPCATHDNAKCSLYYTADDDGLTKDWAPHTVFMNPPYGRQIKHWIAKAHQEWKKGATVVCLIPSRTDTSYWHDYITEATDIRFIRGRLKFNDGNSPAPFPSAVVVFA